MDRDVYAKIIEKLKTGESVMESLEASASQITETTSDIFTPDDTYVNTDRLFFRERIGIVTVNGYVKLESATAASVVIGSIAEGHRPGDTVRIPCGFAAYAYEAPTGIGYLAIATNGDVMLTSPANNTSLCVYLSCSYIAQN